MKLRGSERARNRLPLVLSVLLAVAPTGLGCRRPPAAGTDEARKLSVARVGNHVVTVAELEQRLNEQSLLERDKYRSDQAKKEFLDRIVRYELLAEEGIRRGYDRDPEIVRSLRQQIATKLVKEAFLGDRPPTTSAEVEKYYREHQDEFRQERQVRALQIVVADRPAAERVAEEAKRLGPDDLDGFRRLVAKYSVDDTTKRRGGDLLFVDPKSQVRRPLLAAILNMKTRGETAGPVEVDGRFHILKVAEVKEGFVRPLAEAELAVRRKLSQVQQAHDAEVLLEKLQKSIRVDLHPENLGKVEIKKAGTPRGPAPAASLPLLPGVGTGKLAEHKASQDADPSQAIGH